MRAIRIAVEEGVEEVGRGRRRIVWRGPDGTTLVVHLEGENVQMVNPSFARRSSISGPNEALRRGSAASVQLVCRRRSDPRRGERITPLATQLEEIGAVDVHAILGQVRDVQITAFAEELEVWRDEDDYESAQRRKEPKFASTSLVPLGLFENPSGREQPYAFLTGIVRDGGERTSSISGKPFVWALVETHGASFDVIATPKQVRSAFGIGSVIQGQFWLMGRLREKESEMKVDELLSGARDAISAKRVFGEPIEDQGVTVIPVAKVGGGGGGGGDTEGNGGGGFGLAGKPAGAYVITAGEVKWKPAYDLNRIVLGWQLVAAPRGRLRLAGCRCA